VQLKRCPKCGLDKAIDEFVKNRSAKDGLGGYCRPCHAAVVRENVKKNHGGGRNFQLQRRYGVDTRTAAWLMLQQDGLCAVCREADPAHLDHCHGSNALRGVLCFNCNRALGYFGDDLLTMFRAADYLESHR
jgi:Recombination endonuclease VII